MTDRSKAPTVPRVPRKFRTGAVVAAIVGCAAVAAPAIALTSTGLTASHGLAVTSHHGYLASGIGGPGGQDDLN